MAAIEPRAALHFKIVLLGQVLPSTLSPRLVWFLIYYLFTSFRNQILLSNFVIGYRMKPNLSDQEQKYVFPSLEEIFSTDAENRPTEEASCRFQGIAFRHKISQIGDKI